LYNHSGFICGRYTLQICNFLCFQISNWDLVYFCFSNRERYCQKIKGHPLNIRRNALFTQNLKLNHSESSCSMNPNPFPALNHLTIPLVIITSSFLKNFQRRKLEGATLTNGFFLQKETVPQVKQDLIDYVYNNLYLKESKLIICHF